MKSAAAGFIQEEGRRESGVLVERIRSIQANICHSSLMGSGASPQFKTIRIGAEEPTMNREASLCRLLSPASIPLC